MFKKLQTKRGSDLGSPQSPGGGSEEDEAGLAGKGSLLFKKGWSNWKPYWWELSGDSLMQFTKRGAGKPKLVIRLAAAILKSADDLVGEQHCFAVFAPQKEPFYFRALNMEQKAAWMSCLAKVCVSTEWSTSSMVTAFLDPVVISSQDGTIIECNDALLKVFGHAREQVIGKNVKMLMPASVAQHHDQYMANYVKTGIAKLVGKPRSLQAQHADGSQFSVVLSLGTEQSPDGKRTFIATLRLDKEKKALPSQVELDALLQKTVDTVLQDANNKIKTSLHEELAAIMKRLEDYQASSKLSAARGLKESSRNDSNESDLNSDETVTTDTKRGNKNEMTIDSSNIVVGRRLGSGGSGCAVYACNVDGWECAMKELKLANAKQSDIDAFTAEVFLLESLPPHKNLVRFLFHQKTSDRIRVFMRRYEGTLDQYLRARRDKDEYLDLGDVARLSLDVVRALEILHDYKIMHRDVKSQNLFVNHDMAGNVSHLTLSDLDSAKVIENAGAAKTIIGTIGWMPPEVYTSSGKAYNFSADIWSFAMVMFELMDLGHPFSDIDEFDRAAYIGAGKLPVFRNPEVADKRYGGLLPIWKKCASLNPADRPALRDIKVSLSQFL